MALGKKNSKSKGEKGKKEGRFVNIMTVLEGKEENDDGEKKPWVKASNYKGRLIWQSFGGEAGDDEEDSTFFEIKNAFIGTPYKDAPEFVLQTIVVNLNNPKAAEEITQS